MTWRHEIFYVLIRDHFLSSQKVQNKFLFFLFIKVLLFKLIFIKLVAIILRPN